MAGTRIITVSREFGSGGRTIARAVAGELGFGCYDRELIRRTAEKTGFAEAFVEEYGEYAPGKTFLSYAAQFVGGGHPQGLCMADQLYLAQRQVILDLAEKGDCVIVGRCADYILRDREDCLHVFIHAPEAYKAERIVRLYGESDRDPLERLREKDTKRRTNYRRYTDREWGVCRNYHLSLDSAALGEETCVRIIVELARGRAGSGDPRP